MKTNNERFYHIGDIIGREKYWLLLALSMFSFMAISPLIFKERDGNEAKTLEDKTIRFELLSLKYQNAGANRYVFDVNNFWNNSTNMPRHSAY